MEFADRIDSRAEPRGCVGVRQVVVQQHEDAIAQARRLACRYRTINPSNRAFTAGHSASVMLNIAEFRVPRGPVW